MGRGDEDALAEAIGSGAEYVGLVASARRAGVVRAALRDRGIADDQLAAVRSPAGLDLGPCTQEEIAVAILAELVAWSHGRGSSPSQLLEAVDPVCGMTVSVDGNDVTYEHKGTTYYFCCPGCRGMFEADPEKALQHRSANLRLTDVRARPTRPAGRGRHPRSGGTPTRSPGRSSRGAISPGQESRRCPPRGAAVEIAREPEGRRPGGICPAGRTPARRCPASSLRGSDVVEGRASSARGLGRP